MELTVLNTNGAETGKLEVSDLLFGVPMNSSVVHQAMVRQMANARQGTSSTKTRGMVSGGGAKPRPQKHSGRSRQGTIRAPQWRHGGIVFGPSPRSYRQRLPKKMRRLAIRCLLSEKVREDQLTVLQALEFPQPKTKEMQRILAALGATSKVLLVTPHKDDAVVMSARGLQKVKTLPAPNLSVLAILGGDRLVMTVDAVRSVEGLWAGQGASVDVVEAVEGASPASGEEA